MVQPVHDTWKSKLRLGRGWTIRYLKILLTLKSWSSDGVIASDMSCRHTWPVQTRVGVGKQKCATAPSLLGQSSCRAGACAKRCGNQAMWQHTVRSKSNLNQPAPKSAPHPDSGCLSSSPALSTAEPSSIQHRLPLPSCYIWRKPHQALLKIR